MQAKGDENIENLDEIAASRVKYTLPGPMTILDCIKGQLISNPFFFNSIIYRTHFTIARSWSVMALVYRPRILGFKNEEFSFFVRKLSAI